MGDPFDLARPPEPLRVDVYYGAIGEWPPRLQDCRNDSRFQYIQGAQSDQLDTNRALNAMADRLYWMTEPKPAGPAPLPWWVRILLFLRVASLKSARP